MHYGVYKGQKADSPPRRILILGESHHVSSKGDTDRVAGAAASYTTRSVIENDYLENRKHRKFFDGITRSFGVDPNNSKAVKEFWGKVYFGNYIDVLCGVGDSRAKNTLKEPGKREQLNDDLFTFINDHRIGFLICFSRLTYNNMPSLSKKLRAEERFEEILCEKPVGGKRDWIDRCVYLDGVEHRHTDVLLKHSLYVCAVRHPTAPCGFNAENYCSWLADEINDRGKIFKR